MARSEDTALLIAEIRRVGMLMQVGKEPSRRSGTKRWVNKWDTNRRAKGQTKER